MTRILALLGALIAALALTACGGSSSDDIPAVYRPKGVPIVHCPKSGQVIGDDVLPPAVCLDGDGRIHEQALTYKCEDGRTLVFAGDTYGYLGQRAKPQRPDEPREQTLAREQCWDAKTT